MFDIRLARYRQRDAFRNFGHPGALFNAQATSGTATAWLQLQERTMTESGGGGESDIVYPAAIPFAMVHAGCFLAIWSGITWQSLVLCAALYWLRIFAIGAGYHRYFSHRAYATSRPFQFLLAFLAQTTAQKSVLWWAAKHRHHHLHSDTEDDVHSPRHKGFLYSHLGWIFARRHDTADLVKVADLAAFPELMWLHRYELLPPLVLAVLCLLIAGWSGLVVGFFWSTVLVYHATFCINSLAHVHGTKRFVTGDDSRNSLVLALVTMGEGWHNNHHACQSSVRQGFRWWEIDATFYVLTVLSWAGIVWDLKRPPMAVRNNIHTLGSRVIERTATQLAASFNSDQIADALAEACCWVRASAEQGAAALALPSLPLLPTRDELFARAKAMFAETRSLEEIVDRAHAILLVRIRTRLICGD
jgi:stearoyl-CoA desaturase (Delta-9 desaturase)